MEAVILIGIQACRKTTFYGERFFDTHVRINLDMLRTRRRESLLLQACIAAGQSFVVDNTNISRDLRRRYIPLAKAAGFRIIGYYFPTQLKETLERNSKRKGKAMIPPAGIAGMLKRLEPPTLDEGFDELHSVTINSKNGFVIRKMLRSP